MMKISSFSMVYSIWFHRQFSDLLNVYDRYIRKALELPKRTVMLILAGILLSFSLIPFIGVSYFPATDSGFFIINIKAPTGTRPEVTAEEVKKVEDLIRRIAKDDVEIIVSNIGLTSDFTAMYTSNTATHTAFIQVELKEDRKESTAQIMKRVRSLLKEELPYLRSYFQSGGLVDAIINQGAPAPIDIHVTGFDLKEVYKIAALVAAKINTLEKARDVFIPQDMDAPSLMLDINREYASELGLSTQEIINTVVTSLTSNQMIAPNYWIDPKNGNDYFLTVQYPLEKINTLQDLKRIPLRSFKSEKTVYLDAVANISSLVSPTVVSHYQLQRVVDIYVTPKGDDLGHLTSEINKIVQQVKLPKNIQIEVRGLVEVMHTSFKSFGLGLILSILLVYLVLVAQFRSFIDPFIILLALCPGLSGSLLILFATGTTFNIISLMGVLMMVGVTVSNSILIVEFTHRLLRKGMNLKEAVIEACKIRLRPILMTSGATLLALFPMSLGLSTGSETYAPLARVIIGGLGVSVLVTVFLIPAACLAIYQRRSNLNSENWK